MKNYMLYACGLCLALILTAMKSSAAEKTYQDTIVFTPLPDAKVILIGEDLESLSHYQKADSIKLLFLKDVATAKENKSFPEHSREVHYLVAGNGKRRLKSESEDYVESSIDIEKEKRSMNLALPGYAYILHDLVSGVEIGIYLKNTEQLVSLENISFNEAILSIANEKKLQRQNYRVDLEKKESLWSPVYTQGNQLDQLEISGLFGLGFINNQASPVIGADFALTFNDKYNIPRWKAGATLSGMVFSDYANKEFKNFYPVTSIDLRFMANISGKKGTATMFGLRGGYMFSEEGGSLDGAWKAGVAVEGKHFSANFDLIRDRDKNNLFGITLIVPILQ